jgi:TRAP-type C4-dicarboxylate transport system substrate-binding protein
MTMTNHLANIGCLCMSEEWYQAQSDEVKAAIDNSAQIYSQVGSQTSMDSIDSVVADLTDKMEIYYPTEAEKEQWLQAGMTVWPICAELCGEDYFKQCLSAMGIDWNG